ncbi:S24 family peptidase [Bosea sp. TND4EK4]|uniref:S24 family peptidase n=1 Tax=Bosea sp. TND4EK4 TaxID=1907408 RepID=UPI000954E544|nr:S24 family peptidase [Bosea sp. TND4EK4]SIP95181.1 Phage repressor protein C, contains Cro/C1-type HTH and peptisase s24 domains [Bosea sp. TND4EK4]
MSTHSDIDASEEGDSALLMRFKEVLETIPSLQTASELVGYSTQQIAKWRDGKARLPFKAAATLARAANRSVDWLAFGAESLSTAMSHRLERVADNDDVVTIPLLDVIASAGPGVENPFPLEVDQLPFPKRWLTELGVPERYARFLGARGDSMEPTIRDGAICLADTRFQTPRIEGVYALVDGNDVRIKRIGRGWEGKIVLISDNERYASDTLSAPDGEALRIAGKIVWAGGKI